VLKELADSLQAFCLIVAIDSSYETVWVVSSVRSRNSLPLVEFPNTGRHTPSHRVAPGIILLGGLAGQELNRALLACTARDENVSLPALRDRVIQDRLQGWSLRVVPAENFSEIAVPLLNAQGQIIASMSVLFPLSKIPADDVVERYLPRIKQAAEEINTLVGYRAPGP